MKVVMIAAVTLDGRIARGYGDPIKWTSKEDKRFFAKKTKEMQIVIMGRETFEAFENRYLSVSKILPDRIKLVLTKKGGKLPEKLEKDKTYFVNYIVYDAEKLLQELENKGYGSAAVIGGNQIFRAFLPFTTDFFITIEPIIFGKGLSFLEMVSEERLILKKVKNLNNKSVLLHLIKEVK